MAVGVERFVFDQLQQYAAGGRNQSAVDMVAFPVEFRFELAVVILAQPFCEADQRLAEVIGRAVACPDPNFGNGRWVHNLVEQGIVKSMARRIMSMPSHDCTDRELMSTITVDDIDRAEQRMLELSAPHRAPMMRIGFRA